MAAHESVFSMCFGEVAGLYDRSRPRYATEALRWALGPPPLRVADLGAGTGILSRQLTALGHDCVAIEPDARMRHHWRQTTGTQVVHGTAEDIPLPDHSVEAVVTGEAYHWFAPHRAHAEIARVLKPGGCFVALWIVRDETTPWAAELTALLARYDRTGKTEVKGPIMQQPFTPAVRKEFPHVAQHTHDSLLDLYRSHSYYITAARPQQLTFERDLEHLIRTRITSNRRARFALPYLTLAYRTRLTDDR
ncbi:class I SAM-dependent methyltransferase [Streptomyces sp. NPDC050636]|uniref:class I SAM-dependent methyltransferase n=1 Tax=Streptomyces sp. NPDC050636 TaxID=3154510 RepID=UPI00342B3AF8